MPYKPASVLMMMMCVFDVPVIYQNLLESGTGSFCIPDSMIIVHIPNTYQTCC